MKRYVVLWLLCLLALNACHAAQTPATIDLSSSSSPSAQISLTQVQRVGAAERARDGVAQQRYAFQPAALPQMTVAPAVGKTWDWTGKGELRLRVQNAMPWAVTLNVDIDSAGKQPSACHCRRAGRTRADAGDSFACRIAAQRRHAGAAADAV
jgi:hypothetical protein